MLREAVVVECTHGGTAYKASVADDNCVAHETTTSPPCAGRALACKAGTGSMRRDTLQTTCAATDLQGGVGMGVAEAAVWFTRITRAVVPLMPSVRPVPVCGCSRGCCSCRSRGTTLCEIRGAPTVRSHATPAWDTAALELSTLAVILGLL